MNNHTVAGFLAIAATSLPTSAQGVWQEVSTTGPAARNSFSMAFDSTRHVTVLFGGSGTPAPLLGDTWTWNGVTWSQVGTAGPTARRDHAMAFDSARGRVVLFGGQDASTLADTWEWDGVSWALRTPLTAPPARVRHSMAFDSQRGKVVLFGGAGIAQNILSDTWEWDGTNWAHVIPPASPPRRMGAAMAFDSIRGKTVLFGGADSVGGLAQFKNDTWEWDGSVWVLASAGGVATRAGHAMAFDTWRAKTISTGGWNGSMHSIDLAWDGVDWGQAGNSWGLGRSDHSMVFDSTRGRMVSFGGTIYSSAPFVGATSELLFTVGAVTPYGTSCGNPTLVLSQNLQPGLGRTPHVTVSPMQSSSAYLTIGFANDFYEANPLPLSLDFMGLTGCLLHHSAEVQGIPFAYLGQGMGDLGIPIPNNPFLVGLHLYLQAYAAAPGANPAEFTTSNGLAWTIGI
ncbi:MAG: kelch repeat-containing protein [Planctomycetota bacterium]